MVLLYQIVGGGHFVVLGGKSLARTYNYQIRVHAFFISNGFFNSSSVLLSSLMNSAPNVAKVLLSTCRHHLNVTLFGFNIFVFMFTPGSIYVLLM